MINSNGTTKSPKIDCLWSLALIVFFTINMNYDWRTGYVAWYGSLLLVAAMYVFVFNGLIQINLPSFFKWMLSYMALGAASMTWCLSTDVTIDVLKTFVVFFVVLLLIQFSISFGYSINSLLNCYFIASIINSIYVFLKIDVAELGDIQLGTHMLEGWNGNGIGFLTAQAALIGVFLFTRYKDKIYRTFLLVTSILLSFLTIYTGSRTAFIVLVAGYILYFWCTHPTKKIKNLLITVAVLIAAFYLVMNVESFYKVLGSRLEGLVSLFSGEGEIDSSADIRNTFIENGKEWFMEKPALGYGLNNYKVLNRIATHRYTYAHNTFIEIAVNQGVVGLVWYYSVYAYLIVRLLKIIKNKPRNAFLLAALVVSLISQYGSVSYYGFYQNLLLMLCFYAVNKSKQERVDTLK